MKLYSYLRGLSLRFVSISFKFSLHKMKILYVLLQKGFQPSEMIDEACCSPYRNVIRKIDVEIANGILTSLLGNLASKLFKDSNRKSDRNIFPLYFFLFFKADHVEVQRPDKITLHFFFHDKCFLSEHLLFIVV